MYNTTYSLASGDLEDLGGETDGALDTELLVLGTVDQVVRDYGTIPSTCFSEKITQNTTYTSPSS